MTKARRGIDRVLNKNATERIIHCAYSNRFYSAYTRVYVNTGAQIGSCARLCGTSAEVVLI